MKTQIAIGACAWALAGCATLELFENSFEPPPGWDIRDFPKEGAFIEAQRYRDFPDDPVFAQVTTGVRRVDPGEERSPMMRLRGVYSNRSDAGRFTDCGTDRRYPVLGRGDYAELERAASGARGAPGEAVQVAIDGRIVLSPRATGPGLEQAILVEKFQGVLPGSDCGPTR